MLITLSTGINVFVLNIVDRDTPVPRWVRIVFLHYIANYVAPSLRQPHPGYNSTKDNKNSSTCSDPKDGAAMNISENDHWPHAGHLVNGYQNNVLPGHPQHMTQFSSRLASHTTNYQMSGAFPKTPDSPIREITELRLDENGKQLVQVRKYLEWIRLVVITCCSLTKLANKINQRAHNKVEH